VARIGSITGLNLNTDDRQLEITEEQIKINRLGNCAFSDNQKRIA
jgi:hypothetical protein